jgi:hypothetical protein
MGSCALLFTCWQPALAPLMVVVGALRFCGDDEVRGGCLFLERSFVGFLVGEERLSSCRMEARV